MGAAPVRQSSEIRLRRAVRSDAAALIDAHRRSRELHSPWVEPFTDAAGFAAWLEREHRGGKISLLASARDSDAICGVATLSGVMLGALRGAFLGYYVMAGFERRGLMTEAVRAASRFAFDELELNRLEANIQPGNAASIALVRKLGFRKEGFSPRYLRIGGAWRDCERWALLADEGAQVQSRSAPSSSDHASPA